MFALLAQRQRTRKVSQLERCSRKGKQTFYLPKSEDRGWQVAEDHVVDDETLYPQADVGRDADDGEARVERDGEAGYHAVLQTNKQTNSYSYSYS